MQKEWYVEGILQKGSTRHTYALLAGYPRRMYWHECVDDTIISFAWKLSGFIKTMSVPVDILLGAFGIAENCTPRKEATPYLKPHCIFSI